MQGEVYKITNKVNNKVYIGKTYIGYQNRWKGHTIDAYRNDKDTKLYRAIRKYGEESFTIELLGRYESGVLEQKEREYIKEYDSFHNGYNSTIGGDGNPTIDMNGT